MDKLLTLDIKSRILTDTNRNIDLFNYLKQYTVGDVSYTFGDKIVLPSTNIILAENITFCIIVCKSTFNVNDMTNTKLFIYNGDEITLNISNIDTENNIVLTYIYI